MMKISYDPQVDALSIRLIDAPAQVTTQRLSEDVAVDYGPSGAIVGIEILDASANAFNSGADRKVLVENLTAIVG